MKEHGGAEDGPVAATERRHGEGYREKFAINRADQPGIATSETVGRWYSGIRPPAIWWRRCPDQPDGKNPMCSADRSTRSGCGGRWLCPGFQNVSFFRIPVEIQVGSFELIGKFPFLNGCTAPSSGTIRRSKAWEARFWEGPSPAVTNRVIWFDGFRLAVSSKLFKLSLPKPPRCEK